MSPMEVLEVMYAAMESGDLAAAGEYLDEDAVLVLKPPPPGTDGTFVGKEAVLGWWEHLIANNYHGELSDATESGNRFTATLDVWEENLPVAHLQLDGAGVVQHGKVKVLSWITTPKSMAEWEAAADKTAN